jgi:hemerythrin-like domain-containing protein
MSNNPINYLIAEHDVISRVEQLIPHLENYWNTDRNAYEKIIQSLFTFFKEYADKFHHFKEEQVLFPKMNAHHDFTQQVLIAELEDHHELFREYLSSMKTFLEEKNYEKVHAILKTYVNELLDHIGAENDELFVMAESLFTDDEIETMYFDFKDIDRELGEDKKQELVETLEQIEKTLLK